MFGLTKKNHMVSFQGYLNVHSIFARNILFSYIVKQPVLNDIQKINELPLHQHKLSCKCLIELSAQIEISKWLAQKTDRTEWMPEPG